MPSKSAILTGDQTFDQTTAQLSRNSVGNQAELRAAWLEAREERLKQYQQNTRPLHERAQEIVQSALLHAGALDKQLATLVGQRSQVRELDNLYRELHGGKSLPQALIENQPLIAEYARLSGIQKTAGSSLLENHLMVANLVLEVGAVVDREIQQRKEQLKTEVGRFVAAFDFSSSLSELKSIFATERTHSFGRILTNSLQSRVARLQTYMSEFASDNSPEWDKELGRRLTAVAHALDRIGKALQQYRLDLQPEHIKAAYVSPGSEVTFPAYRDLRETFTGRVYLLMARHFDAAGVASSKEERVSEQETLLQQQHEPEVIDRDHRELELYEVFGPLLEGESVIESNLAPEVPAATLPRMSFTDSAASERQQMLRELVADYPAVVINTAIAAAARDIDSDSPRAEVVSSLKDLVLKMSAELEDTATFIVLEYALPEDVAYRAAQSRFASGGFESFYNVLSRFGDVNEIFSTAVRIFPELLLTHDIQVAEYLETVRAVRSEVEGVSPLLGEYFSTVREIHQSRESLNAYAAEIRKLGGDPKARLEAEIKAVIAMTRDDLMLKKRPELSPMQYEMAAEILAVGMAPTPSRTHRDRDVETMRKMIERVLEHRSSCPLLFETITLILEGSLLACTSKQEMRPSHKTYRVAAYLDPASSQIMRRIRALHAIPAVVATPKPEAAPATVKLPEVTKLKPKAAPPPPDPQRVASAAVKGAQEAISKFITLIDAFPADRQKARSLLTEYRFNNARAETLAARLLATAKQGFNIASINGYRGDFDRACFRQASSMANTTSRNEPPRFSGGNKKARETPKTSLTSGALQKMIRSQAVSFRPDTRDAVETCSTLLSAHEALEGQKFSQAVLEQVPALGRISDIIQLPRDEAGKGESGQDRWRTAEILVDTIWPSGSGDTSSKMREQLTALNAELESWLKPAEPKVADLILLPIRASEEPQSPPKVHGSNGHVNGSNAHAPHISSTLIALEAGRVD